MLDLFAMNDDGNLMDAACIAAVAALMDAKIPVYDEKLERVKFGEWTNKKLPLEKEVPVLMTFHKIGNRIILDPIVEEEESSDTRIGIGILDGKINAMQKGNDTCFELEEAYEIFEQAEKKYKELGKIIEEQTEKSIKDKKKED